MPYDASLVSTILARLRAVYDSVLLLDGSPTGEPHAADTLTRKNKEAEQLQRQLVGTGYPVPDDWLLVPGDIKIGPPNENRHCAAWVIAEPKLRVIREQLRQAILRLEASPTSPIAPDASVWVLISKLEPPRIPNLRERRRYVENHKTEIRSRRALTKAGTPHPKRLEVHIGDWVKHWGKLDGQIFDNLDSANPDPLTKDELTEDFMGGATKLYAKVFQGKQPRK